MSNQILEITDSSFRTDVIDSTKPVLVDFWAPWCGPCKAIGPAIEALAEAYGDRVQFAKCNVDEHAETPGLFGIRSIPTLLFFKDGKVVDKITGMVSKGAIEESIGNLLSGKTQAQLF